MCLTRVTHSCREVGTCSTGWPFGFSSSLCINVFLFPSPPPTTALKHWGEAESGRAMNLLTLPRVETHMTKAQPGKTVPTAYLSLKSAGKPYPLPSVFSRGDSQALKGYCALPGPHFNQPPCTRKLWWHLLWWINTEERRNAWELITDFTSCNSLFWLKLPGGLTLHNPPFQDLCY